MVVKNSVSDPDSGFDDQKIGKNLHLKKYDIFLLKNRNILIPKPP
jgi:hypothetical protein